MIYTLHSYLYRFDDLMHNRRYYFRSVYCADKSAEEVWRRMTDVESWTHIWKYFRTVKIADGTGGLRTGSVVHCKVRAAMFYNISFIITVTKMSPPLELEVKCSGDLSGEGRWSLVHDGVTLRSRFDWDVETNHWLLNIIGRMPFGRSLLEHNHRVVMDEGFRSFIGV